LQKNNYSRIIKNPLYIQFENFQRIFKIKTLLKLINLYFKIINNLKKNQLTFKLILQYYLINFKFKTNNNNFLIKKLFINKIYKKLKILKYKFIELKFFLLNFNKNFIKKIYLKSINIKLIYNSKAQFNILKNFNNKNSNLIFNPLHIKNFSNLKKKNSQFNKKSIILSPQKNLKFQLKKNRIFTKYAYNYSQGQIKQFLSKLTNLKINLIFINALSFVKFFFLITEEKKKKKEIGKFNILQIQRLMLNKYKYHAIFIKDFIHLAFICILLKEVPILVNFMGEQFKRLPKNRKQLKLLNFITQSIKIFSQQRKELLGFKLQIKGRLNRRTRSKK
jgi:hypothetical protein